MIAHNFSYVAQELTVTEERGSGREQRLIIDSGDSWCLVPSQAVSSESLVVTEKPANCANCRNASPGKWPQQPDGNLIDVFALLVEDIDVDGVSTETWYTLDVKCN
ncbi:MAG: hypothetical protein ACQEXJ_12095 [Myxococcota bacterium]